MVLDRQKLQRPRRLHRLSVVACLVVVTAATACITPTTPRQAANRTSVAVSLMHQGQIQGWGVNVPNSYRTAATDVLAERNLTPVVSARATGGAELTSARLSQMATASSEEILVLIESSSRFDSQIAGRYRWTVFAKVTVANAKDLNRQTSRSFDVPITLEYDHQRDSEALALAAGPIAKQLGVVIDSYLASYGAAPSIGPPPLAPPPGPTNARSSQAPKFEAIYFVMVDRFANGNEQNDGADADPTDPVAWHGGDFAGLRTKLEYIAGLGVTDLWLSPITSTRAETIDGRHGAFHGYWTEDLRRHNPRFGTEKELRELAAETKRQGLALTFDLVLNHVGPGTELATKKPSWFHPDRQIRDFAIAEERETGRVHGLPDLDQANPEVYDYLKSAALGWASHEAVTAFRLDAVRHIAPTFWRRFLVDLKAEAPHIESIGEIYDGNPAAIAEGFALGFDKLFDFPLHYAAQNAFCKSQSLLGLAGALGADRNYPAPSRLVTFADNHDTARAASTCSDAQLAQLMFFLLSVRGIPAITYGTESGMTGREETDVRSDMNFESEAPIGRVLREGLAKRAKHPSLRATRREFRIAEPNAIIWLQQGGGETAVLGISRKNQPTRVRLGAEAIIESGFKSCGARCLELAPGAVGVAWLNASGVIGEETRRVELRAQSGLLAGGNIPELGTWNLREAKTFADGVIELELPVGMAFQLKLARDRNKHRNESGKHSPHFEGGANRVILVTAGEGPLTRNLTWQK